MKNGLNISNLLELITLINEAFIDRKQTDVIHTDFSKAFDKVNHYTLLNKLNIIFNDHFINAYGHI